MHNCTAINLSVWLKLPSACRGTWGRLHRLPMPQQVASSLRKSSPQAKLCKYRETVQFLWNRPSWCDTWNGRIQTSLYRKLHILICIDDLLFDTRKSIKSPGNDLDGQNENEQDDDDVEQVLDADSERIDSQRWTDQSFIKPYRALQELSGFHALNVTYKILVSLAITSSSAERAMSRVRLIKNRLRTTMLDDWFSSLMILASEKDVLERVAIDRIIDKFASLSTPLQKLLM